MSAVAAGPSSRTQAQDEQPAGALRNKATSQSTQGAVNRKPRPAQSATAAAAAVTPATHGERRSPSGVLLPLLLGGVVGSAAVGMGALLLLLRARGRRRRSGRGSGGKGAPSAGPYAKLKPTCRCVPLTDGSACVVRREIAADNSCLFNSVGYAMHKSRTRAPHLRTVVAQQVASDRTTYSDAFLGMSNEAYCNWIRQPFNWGGGIELSILAQAYGAEIAAWNIESCKEHIFGEESGYKRQTMVIYNGVHYDALAVCAGPRANPDDDETSYNPRTKRGKMIIAAARKLVELAHKESLFHGASAKKQQQQRQQQQEQQQRSAAAAAAVEETALANGTASVAGGGGTSHISSSSGRAAATAATARKAGSGARATRRVARSAIATAAAAGAAPSAATAVDSDTGCKTASADATATNCAADATAADAPPDTAAVPDVTDTGEGAAATHSKLSCGGCEEVCVGAAAAQQHALVTGHDPNYVAIT